MYPRIKHLTIFIVAVGLLFTTTGCAGGLITIKVNTRGVTEAPPNHSSPLFRTWATNEQGGEIAGNFIAIRGYQTTLGVGYDMPLGQLTGNYTVLSASYRLGSGKWIKIKQNRYRYGPGTFNIYNKEDGSENKLFIRTIFAYEAVTYDDQGEPSTKRVQVPNPAIKVYQVRFYRN